MTGDAPKELQKMHQVMPLIPLRPLKPFQPVKASSARSPGLVWCRAIAAAALTLASAAAPSAWAMRFDIVETTLILSGPVVDGDLARMRDALMDKSLRQVLLHQSPGGDAWTGLRLGHEIRQAGLKTLLSGQCASACGLMFLGGVERRLTDGMAVRENRLLLHGAWDPNTGKTLSTKAPELAHHIRHMTDGKYPEALMQLTVNPARAQDFMEFALTPRMLRMPQPRGVFQCLVSDDKPRQCQELDGYSAINTGVVTHAEIVALEPALRQRLPP
jgi:hypothetical protein